MTSLGECIGYLFDSGRGGDALGLAVTADRVIRLVPPLILTADEAAQNLAAEMPACGVLHRRPPEAPAEGGPSGLLRRISD